MLTSSRNVSRLLVPSAFALTLVLVPLTSLACAQEGTVTQPPSTPVESWSYALGADLGARLSSDSVEIDIDQLVAGLQTALAGGELALDADQMQAAIQSLQEGVAERRQQAMAEAATKNKAEGEAFLAENKARPEIKTTASGLQYEVLEEGSGDSPLATDRVKVHYAGTLIDGTPFDSSYDRGTPATFGVNAVIAGWTEALQLMKPGAKYRLYVPSDLAYGPQGPPQRGPQPPIIGPNSALIFDVELIEVNPAH